MSGYTGVEKYILFHTENRPFHTENGLFCKNKYDKQDFFFLEFR